MQVLRLFIIAVALAATMFPAAAADLPIEPVYQTRPVVVVFRWTGVYIGAHVGGGGGFKNENSVAFPFALSPVPSPCLPPGCGTIAPSPASIGVGGWFAGGQIGANYQIGSWVIGVEGQAGWANFTGSTACGGTAVPAQATVTAGSCTAKIDSLGTAAVRLGWAFDHLLLYGKGGAAWTNDSYQVKFSTPLTQMLFSTNELRWGWMFGVGVEYAFTDTWSAKIEYNYMDLGADSLRLVETSGALVLDTNIRERLNVVKIGVNYRFGVTPILIK
jgi:outer membrane immunogenic protein